MNDSCDWLVSWSRDLTPAPLDINGTKQKRTKKRYITFINMIIRMKNGGVDKNEWAIIELQGDLESRSDESLNDQFIGDLHFTKSGIPILIVGHHILYGKEVNLDKPFAVLEKRQNDQEVDRNTPIVSENRTSYIAKAIVKKKLVFRVRPKPIISNIQGIN